jgi:CubicO group peptidase (beta-lactamase class C family)
VSETAGLDVDGVRALMEYAVANESRPYRGDDPAVAKADRLRQALGPGADVDMVGPFTPPGRACGVMIRHGEVVAEFGDTRQVSEIASATKSFLSLLCGVAVDAGLIADVHQSVHRDTRLDLLASSHNREITWHHLLQQTSEWDGELFGKVPSGHRGERVGERLKPPGGYWEYNDVRVNLLARCLLEVFQVPLPDALRRAVMAPLGGSDSWSWHGYSTSWVEMAERPVQSVSGGAHWGGGIWMNARDLALVGHLYLRDGELNGRRVISPEWIRLSRSPCALNYMYGYLWWLQHDREGRQVSFAAQGGGSHHCFVVPDHDLVVVVRWLADEAWPGFLDLALGVVADRPALGPVHYDWSRINAR